MEHVVTHPRAPFHTSDGRLEIHQIPSFQDNLIWLAVCTKTRRAAVVDGPEAGTVLAYCETHGIELAAVWNTHTHMDHVGINHDLAARGMLDGLAVYGPAKKQKDVPGITHPLSDGDTARVGEVEAQVWLTEGHIDGHVSYVVDDAVFCGDTLFAAGCGYLFDGPPAKMHDSLSRLASLPGGTRVCCAHEYTKDNLRFAFSVERDNEALKQRIRDVWALRERGECAVPSTIGEERETNPFLRHDSEAIRASLGRAWPDRPLDSAVDVFAATRALKDRKDYRTITDEELLG